MSRRVFQAASAHGGMPIARVHVARESKAKRVGAGSAWAWGRPGSPAPRRALPCSCRRRDAAAGRARPRGDAAARHSSVHSVTIAAGRRAPPLSLGRQLLGPSPGGACAGVLLRGSALRA